MATGNVQSSQPIGRVSNMSGVITATRSNGEARNLSHGETVRLDEVIQAQNGSTVHIDFDDGGFATIGSGQSLTLDNALYESATKAASLSKLSNVSRELEGDIEYELYNGIDTGEGLMLDAEISEAEAFEHENDLDEEGAGVVIVHQNAARGQLTPGFETSTFAYNYETEPEYVGAVYEPLPDIILETGTINLVLDEAGLHHREQSSDPTDEGSMYGQHGRGGVHPTSSANFFAIDTHGQGLGDITINGQSIISLLNGGGPITITIDGFPGVFVISDIQLGPDGKYHVYYGAELTDNYDHRGESEHSFEFDIVVTNSHGLSASAKGSIVVIDDNPIAYDDYQSMTETGTYDNAIEGNVFTGDGNEGDEETTGYDVAGADGFSHITWDTAHAGTYTLTEEGSGTGVYTITDGNGNTVGTITLAADGSYRFELDPEYDVPLDGSIEINIPYFLVDNDGDSSRAVLHITVEGNNEVPVIRIDPDNATVHEDGLNTGTVTGSHAGEGEHPVTGESTIFIESSEQIKYITIAGHEMRADTDANGVSDGDFSAYQGEIIYIDANGNECPQADSVGYITIESITQGVDGYEIDYTFTLTTNLTGDGTQTNNAPGDESGSVDIVVNISVTDQTNDSASGTFTITVLDDTPYAPDFMVSLTETGDRVSVEGNVLTDSNDVGETVVYGADGEASDSKMSWGEVPASVGENGQYGFVSQGSSNGWVIYQLVDGEGNTIGTLRLSANNDGKYEFELEPGYTLDLGEEVSIKIPYSVKDGDGDTATGELTLTLNGNDSVPTINPGNVVVYEKGLQTGAESGDNRYGESPGSSAGDGSTSATGKTTIVTDEIIDEITIKGKTPANFEVSFNADGNGDYNIGSDNLWFVNENGEIVPEGESIGFFEILSITRLPNGNYEIEYRFTLTDNAQNGGPGSENDHAFTFDFAISATDHTGDESSGDVSVSIIDDKPVANNDTIAFDENYDTTVSGNVLENDHSGADGWGGGGWSDGEGNTQAPNNGVTGYKILTTGYEAQDGEGNVITNLEPGVEYNIYHDGGLVGTFILNENGDYTFTRPDGSTGMNEDVNLQFQYTVQDGDGDTDTAILTIEIENSSLGMYLTGDSVVYEEEAYGPIHGAEGWNNSGDGSYTTATYFVHFTAYKNGAASETPGGSSLKAGMDYTFELAYKSSGSNGATYGDDVMFTAESGGETVYLTPDTEQDYIDAMNEQLAEQYGLNEDGGNNVSIVGIEWQNGKPVITFQVKDGTILDDPLKITMETVNDNLNDSGEVYELALQNPSNIDGGSAEDVNIIRDPDGNDKGAGRVDTTIYDGDNTGYGSGQWLKLVDVTVAESTVYDGVERGSDVVIGVRLYDPEVGGDLYTGREPPEEDMTLHFSYREGTAEAYKDYVPDANEAKVPTTAWVAYDADGKPVVYYDSDAGEWVDTGEEIAYWEADATIEGLIVDDRLTEPDEQFEIIIDSVEGNESAPVYSDDIGGQNDSGATITITDDNTNHPEDGSLENGQHYKDGPRLETFELVNGKGSAGDGSTIVEPIAPGVDGDGSSDNPTTNGTYLISMDEEAAEDIIVTLQLGGDATLGEDFDLVFGDSATGEGLLTWDQLNDYYADKGGLPDYFTPQDGADPNDYYYVIIKEGEASAKFEVEVRHDHDSSSKPGGLDDGIETIDWDIVGMDGSEVQWDANDHKNHTSNAIEDDMMGPTVMMGDDFDLSIKNVLSGSVELAEGVKMGESVDVTIKLIGSDGNYYFYTLTMDANGDPVSFQVDLSEFKDSNGNPLDPGDLTYFYLQISNSFGGETRIDPTVSEPFIVGKEGNEWPGGEDKYLHITVGTGDGTIYEGGTNGTGNPKSVTYDIDVKNVLKSPEGQGASFTIRPIDNTTDGDDFNHNDVEVNLSSELLDALRNALVDDFQVQLVPDEDGNPQIVLVVNGEEYRDNGFGSFVNSNGGSYPAGDTSVTGQLPTANEDDKLEGDEFFTPIVVDPSNNVYPDETPPEKVTVKDDNDPFIEVKFGYVDKETGEFVIVNDVTEGDMTAPGGEPYVVRVSLIDAGGSGLVNDTNDPIVVKLTLHGTAEDGSDIIIYSEEVTLYPGQSIEDVQVTFPNDYISDDGKTFSVEAEIVSGPGGIGGPVYDNGNGSGDSSMNDVIIHDLIDGPNVSLGFAGGQIGGDENKTTTIKEDGTVDFLIKLDKAVEEDSTVKVKLTFESDDTAQGMSPDDIQSITIDGQTYNVSDIVWSGDTGTVGDLTITRGTDGDGKPTWTFDVPVHEGTAGSEWSITMENDMITEGTEHLGVEIVGTEGGELRYDPDAGGLTVDVQDVLDGPEVSLTVNDERVNEGDEISFSLGLSKEAEDDFTASFTLDGDWKNMLQPEDDGNYYAYYNGEQYLINDDGTFTIQVDAGSSGSSDITFNTKPDNSVVDGDRELNLTLNGVDGAEASVAGAPGMDYILESQDGAGSDFLVTSQGTFDANATVRYFFDGLSDSDAANSRAYVDGRAYTLQQGDDGRWYIEVEYNAGDSINDTIRIENVNGNGSYTSDLSISSESTLSAGVTVVDDNPGSGPVIGISDNGEEAVEGGWFSFNFDGSTLPDDTPELVTGLRVTISFTMDGVAIDPNGEFRFTDGNGDPLNLNYTYSNGQLTITLPEGMSADDLANLNVSVPIADDGGEGGSITAGISNVTQEPGAEQYENPQFDNGSITKDVNPNPDAPPGPQGAPMSAGTIDQQLQDLAAANSMRYTIALAAAGVMINTADSGLEEAIQLKLGLDGMTDAQKADIAAQLASLDYVEAVFDSEGGFVAILLHPGYSHGDSLSFITEYTPGSEHDQIVTLEVDHASDSLMLASTAASGEAQAADTHAITASDATGVVSKGDGTEALLIEGNDEDNLIIGNDDGNVILSGEGDNIVFGGNGDDIISLGDGNNMAFGLDGSDIIVGGSGDDLIAGGAGDDILTGGSGQDVFHYESDDLESVVNGDIITDFHVGGHNDPHADVLDIGSLLIDFDGEDQDLLAGGFLVFENIQVTGNGAYKVVVSVDRDGIDGDGHAAERLATISMDNLVFSDPAASVDVLAQQLLSQLTQNDQISFK